ncbi:uncharacterized protein PITG_17677 [Phytophthora infestans T30-4]|uniref:Uncharacterized protein n=1 Tax=Phytophthora infestans (strain T30-4) TaxID=403677 RepID=D0NWL4_PHYIT|nr:uncharacterized protein PITG_17677 [Phytophthora infestans T30-4]EEY67077.1 conserved hypothetical protein [Phytophthora infestans T30-4]|eukprot:XP_002896529.1 conserved hypothetical protein [Phytophthora infestans T30-4]
MQQSPPISPFARNASNSKKPKKQRRRDRNRPRHEIAQLQAEALKLERKLQDELTRASKRARDSFNTHIKNTELKGLIRESITDLLTLEQNLHTQMRQLVDFLPCAIKMGPRNVPFDTTRDGAVFRRMARSTKHEMARCLEGWLDEQYTDMERVLRLAGFDDSKSELADACICTKSGGQVCTMRMVMKQYMEKERVVQVWSALSHWPLVGDIRNVQTLEQGWSFIQPVECDTSVCLSYIVLNPVVKGYVVDQSCNEKLESLAELYQEMIISRLHALESQTLDQVARKKSDAVVTILAAFMFS